MRKRNEHQPHCKGLTPLPDALSDQRGLASRVARQRCEVGRSAGCTALAVVRLKASGTEITGTAPGRRKQSNFGSSSNRFADECPLLGVKRTLRRPGARRYAISDGGLRQRFSAGCTLSTLQSDCRALHVCLRVL